MFAGSQFLDIHLDGTFARDARNRCVRVGHLDTHCIRQADTHRSKTAGIQPAAWLVERIVLGCPHLVLADVGSDESVTLGDFPQFFDNVLGLDDLIGFFGIRGSSSCAIR